MIKMERIMTNILTDEENVEAFNKMDVLEKWEDLGFLQGVEEDRKKYLADLFENLANAIVNMDAFDPKKIAENISFNDAKVTYFNNEKEVYLKEQINEFLEVVLFPILRKCFMIDNTISFNEFIDGLNNATVDNNFIKELEECTDCDKEAELCCYLADEINKYIKKHRQ